MNALPIDLTKLLAACLPGQTVKLRDGTTGQLCLTPDSPPCSYPYFIIKDMQDTAYYKPDGTVCIPWPERDIIDILPPFLHLP